VTEISSSALNVLRGYRWPGNIRELRNVIERAVLLCSGTTIEPVDLPLDKMLADLERRAAPARASRRAPGRADTPITVLPDALGQRQRLIEALEACDGNQTRAAELLGISRRTLVNWMNKYDLPRPRKDKRRRD